MKHFYPFASFDVSQLQFALGTDRNGKPTISMTVAPAGGEVAMVTAPAVTQWPRVSGDGNYGTMWGPSDPMKAKYTLDLTDAPLDEMSDVSPHFITLSRKLEQIDERLLDFVHNNQLRILGRKNLTREEVKMLQIRSVRPKYDKCTGGLAGHTVQTSTSKYAWDGSGSKHARQVAVCDKDGNVVPDGNVQPGDIVAATIYVNQVYTGVGGDKFGIHWGFQDVQVVCQRSSVEAKSEVSAFPTDSALGRAYVAHVSEPVYDAQFAAA